MSAIRTARAADNDVKAAKLLGGALKQLKLSRLKPDTTLNSALVTLVRELPAMFSAPAAIEGLVQVLKREPSIIFKAKSNPSVYVLAAQLLLFSLKDSYDWPELVAKVSSTEIWCSNCCFYIHTYTYTHTHSKQHTRNSHTTHTQHTHTTHTIHKSQHTNNSHTTLTHTTHTTHTQFTQHTHTQLAQITQHAYNSHCVKLVV